MSRSLFRLAARQAIPREDDGQFGLTASARIEKVPNSAAVDLLFPELALNDEEVRKRVQRAYMYADQIQLFGVKWARDVPLSTAAQSVQEVLG